MYAPPNLGPDYAAPSAPCSTGSRSGRGCCSIRSSSQGVAAIPPLNQPDGMHPNAEGVRRNVARLLPLVEKLLAEVPPA